jgi:hypothetical protein
MRKKIAIVYGLGVVGYWALVLWAAFPSDDFHMLYIQALMGLIWPAAAVVLAVAAVS